MAHHKDAIKRAKQSENARIRNRTYRSKVRNQVKKVRAAIASGDAGAARAEFVEAMSVIQHVATRGVIHKNQAARKISRLHAAIKAMGSGS